MEKWSNDWVLENLENILTKEQIEDLLKYIGKRIGNEEDSYDIFETASADLIDNLKNKKFNGSTKKQFWRYFYTIIDNKIKDYYEEHNLSTDDRGQKISYIEDESEAYTGSSLYNESVEKQVIDKMILEDVINKMKNSLTEGQKDILWLTALGYNSPEIGELIDKSAAAVRKSRQRGRNKLKKELQGKNPMEGFDS